MVITYLIMFLLYIKNLAKSKKNKEENDETDLHQLEEEISKLKSENDTKKNTL